MCTYNYTCYLKICTIVFLLHINEKRQDMLMPEWSIRMIYLFLVCPWTFLESCCKIDILYLVIVFLAYTCMQPESCGILIIIFSHAKKAFVRL